ELRVEELSDESAASLLDARALGLDPPLRARVLREAAGNPLALVELPVALGATEEADPSLAESMLPLTDDLALAFAGRLSSLSHGARSLLRVAAADESEALEQLLGAASTLEGRAITLETVAEAVAAGLIDMDGQHLHFRHPLTPSAIHQAMSLRERRAVHAALASMLEGDPERRA